jgi:hypothetical protein
VFMARNEGDGSDEAEPRAEAELSGSGTRATGPLGVPVGTGILMPFQVPGSNTKLSRTSHCPVYFG